MLQATLTLPGMAAIALTLGMAIDANVLINERVREELRNGAPPQHRYPYAAMKWPGARSSTANVTTLDRGHRRCWPSAQGRYAALPWCTAWAS